MSRVDEHLQRGDVAALTRARTEHDALLVWRDGDRKQRVLALDDRGDDVSIGRVVDADVPLPWDRLASRVHCALELHAGEWFVVDRGSTNGTFVNQGRVHRSQRLSDGDLLRVGATALVFRRRHHGGDASTALDRERFPAVQVPPRQLAVLMALSRPVLLSGSGPDSEPPATNAEIAAELHVGIDAVKKSLKALYAKFAIGLDVPGGHKRRVLVERAIDAGLIAPDGDGAEKLPRIDRR